MAAAGHEFFAPSYTGLGERAHLAGPANDLETHIQDVLGVIKYEDLRDVVLIGHSYGGMVVTGVADQARDRVAGLVYLDAFVPANGQALIRTMGAEERQRLLGSVKTGDGWRVTPNPISARHGRGGYCVGVAIPHAAIGPLFRAADSPPSGARCAAFVHSLYTLRRQDSRSSNLPITRDTP